MTVEDARARYGVPSSTIWSWKRRGRIHHYGEDERGRHLYRVRDVLDLRDGDRPARPSAGDSPPSLGHTPGAERVEALLAGLVYVSPPAADDR
ncbi:helix-turn-helix domain-containing protein [Streptomyces sp. SID12501]|uniref:Helix-turn-helix domain-containing protein n=1 Tax=Streptomyces sp. SID12501 TaxID=2706042 RepID=A0A6B3C8T2_9ACTN|nr:helix-turn-helix domain-containing protein [Streptomyces sp. SID12501]